MKHIKTYNQLFERRNIGTIYHFTSLVNTYHIITQDMLESYRPIDDSITKMYKSCRRACAFSLLSYHGYEAVKNSSELACYEPWDIMKFCFELTSSVIIDHASTPAEYIVSLHKEN